MVRVVPVAQARGFFAEGEARTPAAATILGRLDDVGATPAIMAMVASVKFGAKQQSRPHASSRIPASIRLQSHFFFNVAMSAPPRLAFRHAFL